jgi:hypothetical protein
MGLLVTVHPAQQTCLPTVQYSQPLEVVSDTPGMGAPKLAAQVGLSE